MIFGAIALGIGETLARRIVEHRAQRGPFRSVDQLTDVKGIGPKTLRRVRGYLRVGDVKE